MTQQPEMRADSPHHIKWDREVQELIKLLVEAVLKLPDSEKRRVIDESVTPLFEALLTLKKVPGIGLIWMALIGSGYLDYAGRLPPLEAWRNEETPTVAPASSDTAKLEETPDVA
jgi:hypothetical protein